MKQRISLEMAASVAIATAFTTGVFAQCDPTWDTTLGNPGITEGYIAPIVSWNDGTGDKLYVGGSATNIGGGGAANDYIAQFDPNTNTWSSLGLGIDRGTTNAFLTKILPWDDGTGEKLYVVGQFAEAGGDATANSFAVWDGTSWSDAGAGFSQSQPLRATYDLLPADLGNGEKLYIAGGFDEIGGVTTGGLATFDGTTYAAWGTGAPITGVAPYVQALQRWNDGSGDAVYACGRFTSLDGVTSRNVARYNVASGAWETFGQVITPTSSSGFHACWTLFDDGNGEALYVGGSTFTIAGDPNVYIVAKWDGTNWTGVGQVLPGRTFDLQVWDDGNGDALYLSGTSADVNSFAKLVGNTWEPVLGSGINNPSVTGTTSSAFGMYVWNNDLIVGGSFSQVGGEDPDTGNGSGTPLPARGLAAVIACQDSSTVITDINVTFGNLIGGDVAEVTTSDDTYFAANSVFGFLSSEPNVLRVRVDAMTTVSSPTDFDTLIETRVNNPGGVMTVSARNYDTNSLNIVASDIALAVTDQTYSVPGIAADPYINDVDGSIQIEFKQVVIATFSLSGFQSRTDLVQFDVN